MVMKYIDFFIDDFLPSIYTFMTTHYIVEGVSLLAFIIAVALLCIIIGGLLIR